MHPVLKLAIYLAPFLVIAIAVVRDPFLDLHCWNNCTDNAFLLVPLPQLAQVIETGHADVAVGGGAETMSRSPYWLQSMRWGQRMNDAAAVDAMTAALSDPFEACHMGITAENIAKRWEISREEQDQLALTSQQRAATAISEGRFAEQVVPVEIKSRRGTTTFETDEHVRSDSTLESLAKLRPVFDPQGTVTAGNASGLNDAAAAVVLMAADEAASRGLKPNSPESKPRMSASTPCAFT